jgi:hypothetical protein
MKLTIRMPDGVYEALKRYKDRERPHLSLNALIVEAIRDEIKKNAPPISRPEPEPGPREAV